ncbi:MAG: SpoIIE family protein phosphatase, partial [Bacteroidota bacterium]
ALVSNNIGNVYWELNDFLQALSYLNKSLELYKQLGSQSGIATTLNSLATHFQRQKDFNQSAKYALSALAIADSINDAEQIKNATEILSNDYFDLKQFKKSLFYYKRFSAVKDTITNVEGAKKLAQKESQMEYEQREQKLKSEQDQKDKDALAEKRKQEIIKWSVSGGLLLVVVFAGFIFRSLRITSKQKSLIEKQKLLVDEQKQLVEEKNKDITDSIHYAKRIQRALLASDTLLNKNLPEYFVFYKPKDIVSGDFYWAAFVNGKFLIITADCTGHGVPGAFMSLLNISLLNEITLQRKITQPDLILNEIREHIISTLNPEGTETESKDGMDCMLCTFDFINNKLEFSAANNPLWIVKNGETEIQEFKPDKQPVGFHSVYKPFTLQSTSLEKGDIIYSFTDGFADQFGGSKGKKFKYKQLEDILLTHSHLPMREQKNILNKTFEQWKGNLEQIDDVLVIGVRV